MTSTATIEALYVVDTVALIWYLLGDKKLSPYRLNAPLISSDTQIISAGLVRIEW
jgi:hypothetical protein